MSVRLAKPPAGYRLTASSRQSCCTIPESERDSVHTFAVVVGTCPQIAAIETRYTLQELARTVEGVNVISRAGGIGDPSVRDTARPPHHGQPLLNLPVASLSFVYWLG